MSDFKGGFKFLGGIPRKNGMGGGGGVIILWNGTEQFRHIILQNKTSLNMHATVQTTAKQCDGTVPF